VTYRAFRLTHNVILSLLYVLYRSFLFSPMSTCTKAPVTQPQYPAGHCCLDSIPDFTYNNHTWARSTTLLFVEQPIGTGFSYGSAFPDNEFDVSCDLDAFLQNFYRVFPHLAPYDFFVMGESYAGMFVPSVARYFHLENKKALAEGNTDRIVVPLKGASLGNGWIEAKTQGPAVIDYSWWHGLIDMPTRDALHVAWENCMLIKNGESGNQTLSPPFHPFNIQDDCALMWGVLAAAGNPNAYDVTTWDPNVDQITFASEVFYNNPLVKAALHAPDDIVWHGCRQGGGRRRLHETDEPTTSQHHLHRKLYMDNERPFSVVPYIADLVDDGIPVVVYNGDRDMTTNMVGTELALNAMKWKGMDQWLDAPRGLWMVDGHQAGWSKEYGNLFFVTVYNSGHMVPYNVPGPAFDLLNRLLNHSSFMDIDLPQVRVEPFKKILKKVSHHSKAVEEVAQPLESTISMSGDGFTGTDRSIGGGASHLHVAGVSIVSMIVGFVLALLSVRRRNNHSTYQRVPNAVSLTN
jgi:Serine carboxypeptidase